MISRIKLPTWFLNQIKTDEGFRDKVYTCTAGKQTIGYGHNLEDNPLSSEICLAILNEDIENTINQCHETFSWFDDLSIYRQMAIIDMVFNMGMPRFKGFKKTIVALCRGDYLEAHRQIIDSKYYRESSSHKRAKRNAKVILRDTAG